MSNYMSEQPSMGSDGLPVRESGTWVREKLYYLERYLDIFSVGMKKKWAGKIFYIDLFSGPGKCRIRETEEEIDGSPLIALKFDFAKYYFFESDPECYRALLARRQTRAAHKDVEIIPGDCNTLIDKVKLPPSSVTLAFIDPTGLSPLVFETIRALTANRKVDLIINFHEGMGIRMNIHQHAKKEGGALDSFVGSGRWRQRSGSGPSAIDDLCREITLEFEDNLRGLGYQTVDRDHIPVKTDLNSLLYYLIFASKHPRGNEFWRKITLISPYGQRKFEF